MLLRFVALPCQAMAVLNGTLTLPAAIEAAQQGHRNYAKRQLTWFRREPEVHWIEGFGNAAETTRLTKELVQINLEETATENPAIHDFGTRTDTPGPSK